MAENKKSFVLYADLIHTLEALDDDEAGRLFKHVLRYVNDQNPEAQDKITKVSFEPIKQQLKRDLREWENIRIERAANGREGGLKSAETRRSKMKQNEAKVELASKNEANEAVNVTVTVNDTLFKEKTPILEIYFKDLPGSGNFEKIAIDLKKSKPDLEKLIPAFRLTASVAYQNFNDFCNHFKRWAVKQNPAPTSLVLKNPIPTRKC